MKTEVTWTVLLRIAYNLHMLHCQQESLKFHFQTLVQAHPILFQLLDRKLQWSRIVFHDQRKLQYSTYIFFVCFNYENTKIQCYQSWYMIGYDKGWLRGCSRCSDMQTHQREYFVHHQSLLFQPTTSYSYTYFFCALISNFINCVLLLLQL